MKVKQMKNNVRIPRKINSLDDQSSFDVLVWDARRRLGLLVKKAGSQWKLADF